MKLNLSDCIRPFYYFCKIFGLSVIQSTRLCGFEYIYILIIFVFNIVCSIRSAFYAYANIQEYFEIQNLLMFISTHYLVLAPFLNLVHYRFINHRLKLLIELTNNLFETKLSMTRSEYCRLFFMVTVMPYCFIIVAITVLIVDFNYNCDILINFDVQIYLLALYLWLLIPTLQYLCWVLIFKYIFNKSVKLLFDVVFRIMLRMPEIRQNDIISNYYHFRIRNILNLIKITLKIKSEIIDLYGFFVILHVGHDLSFLIHNIYSIINSNCLEWKSILPRWMLLITSLYLPFWISTKTSNHVIIF